MGTLFVVGTPIGNLKDITLRALEIFRTVDAIFCEDTRVTSKLLTHYEISKPLFRADEVQERDAAEKIVALLEAGQSVALATDAGTPCISDPGWRIVKRAREVGAKIEVIPGVSSVTAALSIAGTDVSEFIFLGFLPHKKGRQTALKKIAITESAIVLFESPHRIEKLLNELAIYIPEREVVLTKELTKIFEAVYTGTAAEVVTKLKADKADRGEFVMIITALG